MAPPGRRPYRRCRGPRPAAGRRRAVIRPARAAAAPDAPDAIIGGVAGLLADRLDVDALWVRIAFVLLALVGGVGVVLYGALWLALVVGRDPSRHGLARRRRGARVRPPVRADGRASTSSTGPSPCSPCSSGSPSPSGNRVARCDRRHRSRHRWSSRRRRSHDRRRPARRAGDCRRAARHPPSILGRLTLGTAVLVAAAGALIDQANGGRLHPEQWLGAAAIVCGAGLLVGTLVGRARWLIVPAALFAGTGFVAGEAARVGVEPTALFGDEYVYVGGDTSGPTQREHVVVGTVDVVDRRSAVVAGDGRRPGRRSATSACRRPTT